MVAIYLLFHGTLDELKPILVEILKSDEPSINQKWGPYGGETIKLDG